MPSDAHDEFVDIRQQMLAAFKEGCLYSYERQPPRGAALQLLASVRSRIEAWIAVNGENPDALRLLALVQESLTQYAAAIETLERLVATRMEVRDDLKRLTHCQTLLKEVSSKTKDER